MAEALLDPGDIVLVESPTYFVFLGLLETRGARAIGVATDEGGLRLDALDHDARGLEARGELDRVKLIYTISEHSNPTGLSLAEETVGGRSSTWPGDGRNIGRFTFLRTPPIVA